MKTQKTEIIAEIANAHQGNTKNAIKLAEQAYMAGACAVKFQIYFADELLIQNHPRYLHFKNQSFKISEWNEIIKKTRKLDIKIYCDVFGMKAFEIAKKNNIDGIKIHSSDLSNSELLECCNKYFNKIIIGIYKFINY